MLNRATLLLALAIAGCSDPSTGDPDAGARVDAAIQADGAIQVDGAVQADGGGPLDATAPGPDAATACEPMAGTTVGDAYCDLFELALFGAGASREARLFGRVDPGTTGCAVIDEVEVLEGSTTVATLPGAGVFASGEPRALLARGPAVAAMTDRCAMEDRRFGGFGLIVRGRMDGGSFEARCADAEGGGRWPPALRITCHEGVEDRALTAHADVSIFGAFTSSTLSVYVPHGPGAALTGVDMRVRVIPSTYSLFGPPPTVTPYDSDGWSGSVSESPPSGGNPALSQIYMSQMSAAFGTELCPPPSTGTPGPGDTPPPVFLVRITGSGELGPYSTEAYVDYCNTISM